MIVSETFELNKVENISTKYIEQELKLKGINPLRWAIVKVNEKTFSINVAYDKI